MPLTEFRRFNRDATPTSEDLLRSVLSSQRATLASAPWVHCGYQHLPLIDGLRAPVLDVSCAVDNAFRLEPMLGFETTPIIVTTGLRSSRFASIVFWEVLHALAVYGIWIDIDEASRCGGASHGFEDYPRRQYFRECLTPVSIDQRDTLLVQTFQKTRETVIAPHIDDCGWTFGILTSGQSSQAAEMAAAILDLDLPKVEVIICGPRPAGAPADARVRAIDLDRPEPRGWITRKKNLIADCARYDNLCLLHDRYVVTPEWADALTEYGHCYSFVTFPQVFYADVEKQMPQRYADYQMLVQNTGITRALASGVYDPDRIGYPDYDDFSETAFCCGGLYVARRCLWNLVKQDETLFHCEWEDVSFGLDCQRRGLPHRVNPAISAESATPHPLALTRIFAIGSDRRIEHGRLHVSAAQQRAAAIAPSRFKPILAQSRHEYYETIRRRFNNIGHLTAEERLPADFADGCTNLADAWSVVDRHVGTLHLRTRDEIAQIANFMGDVVYKWPSSQIQAWIYQHEHKLRLAPLLDRYRTIVGWGTGSAFRAAHRRIGRPLSFVIDSNEATWGHTIEGVPVRPPAALEAIDDRDGAVVVFSCFFDEIAAAVAATGCKAAVLRASEVACDWRFQPLTDLVGYFAEVEQFYPQIFSAGVRELAA